MAWEIYQRIRLGLSKDKKSDIKKLVEYSKADVAAYKDASAYALRALVEFRYGSKDCEKTKSFVKKAIDAGGSVDTFSIAGSIYKRCSDLKSAISFYKNALQLAPMTMDFLLPKVYLLLIIKIMT